VMLCEIAGDVPHSVGILNFKIYRKSLVIHPFEDWKMFKDEVQKAYIISPMKICTRGDDEQKALKWNQLREGRTYLVLKK